METYKYKEFETQTELFLSMPKCNKQITFDGKYFHGSSLLTDNDKEDSRYIIAINLWDKRPTNVDYYNPDINTIPNFLIEDQILDIKIENSNEIDSIKTINVCKKTINYNLYEEILYTCNEKACYIFNELINNIIEHENVNILNNSYKIVLDTSIEKKKVDIQLKNKYGDAFIRGNNGNLSYFRKFIDM